MTTNERDPRAGSPASPVRHVDFAVAAQKRLLRSAARQHRERMDPAACRERDLARARAMLPRVPRDAVVATYLSRSGEPSTVELAAVLWRRGHRILAPLLGRPGNMRRNPTWSWYGGPSSVRPGVFGIPEPVGAALPAEALSEADVVILSGLAAGRDGTRLGAGAGWFDRALAHAREDAQVWLLVNDEELHDTVPTEEHDRKVSLVVTESEVLEV